MKPLPVPIPLEYAEVIGVDRTLIIHVNKGRRHLSAVMAIKLLESGADDQRLTGLSLPMLRPEATAYHDHFERTCCPKCRKRDRRKKRKPAAKK